MKKIIMVCILAIIMVVLCGCADGKTTAKIKEIAKALGISLSELMDDPGTKKEPTASDGQTSPVDGNLATMYAKFSLLSPADQQRVLDFAEGILSARER